MKKVIAMLIALPLFLLEKASALVTGRNVVPMLRMRTCDVAFAYRMGAGFAGDVNRTHPASIEPVLVDTTTPPDAYGQAVLINAAGDAVRKLAAADSAVTDIYGVLVRPYPTQQASASNFGAATLGAAVPPASGIADVLKDGYIMVNLPAGGVVKKGGQVFVWIAADSGSHKAGGFEAAASGGNTIALSNAKFNGAADASGNVEIVISPARN